MVISIHLAPSLDNDCAALRQPNRVLPHGLYTETTVAIPNMSTWATDKEIRSVVGADAMPSIVPLSPADQPLVGSVVCDDVGPIYLDQVTRDAGALSVATLRRVETALKYVLSLP